MPGPFRRQAWSCERSWAPEANRAAVKHARWLDRFVRLVDLPAATGVDSRLVQASGVWGAGIGETMRARCWRARIVLGAGLVAGVGLGTFGKARSFDGPHNDFILARSHTLGKNQFISQRFSRCAGAAEAF